MNGRAMTKWHFLNFLFYILKERLIVVLHVNFIETDPDISK